MSAEQDPDAALMLRVKQGDMGAFTELVDKYKQPVINVVFRTLRDATEAEDLAQNVFVQVYKSAHRYKVSAKFSTWLFTITRNLAINYSRRRKRSPVRNVTELNLEGVDISGDPWQVAQRATDDVEKQEGGALVFRQVRERQFDSFFQFQMQKTFRRRKGFLILKLMQRLAFVFRMRRVHGFSRMT